MESRRKAVILARVSTKEQEEDGFSLPAQEKIMKDYAKRSDLNLDVVKPFSIAESASKTKQRKIFNEMMVFVNESNIKVLIVEKVDRLTRSFKDMVMIDEWLEEDEERQIHLVKDGLVLHKNARSQEKLNWGVKVLFAKNYIDNLREEVAKGVKEKLEQGWYPATRPPIGYKHTGEKGHKEQIIDVEKAPLVKLAFELYDSGNYSILSLSKELDNQGLTSVVGKPLSKSYVHMMLRDKFYVGIMTWCGVEYPGKFEALIDEDLFERVQARLGSGTTPKVEKELTLMHKKARCGQCGGIVSWYKQKGRWYGECKSRKHTNDQGCARQDLIEEELAEYFNELIAPSPAIIAWVKKELRQSHAHETEQYNAAIGQLTNRHRRIDEQLKVLYEDRLDGRIPPELYDQKFKEKSAEREEVAKNLTKLSENNTDYIEKGIDILELTQRAAEIFRAKPVEAQRVLLGDIFSNITLNGKHTSVIWRPETELVRNAVEKTKRLENYLEPSSDPSNMGLSEPCRSVWLRGLDSNQRPSGYTYPITFIMAWTISSSYYRMQGANGGLLLRTHLLVSEPSKYS